MEFDLPESMLEELQRVWRQEWKKLTLADDFIFSLFDDCDLLDEAEIINSITYEYVTELLNTLFKDEYYAMSVVYPSKEEN